MMTTMLRAIAPAMIAFTLAACGGNGTTADEAKDAGHADDGGYAKEDTHADEGAIALTARQIADAGIEIVRPSSGGSALTLPATIEADPQQMQVVSAAITGRVVLLSSNLGETIDKGSVLAIIESREAASLNAEIEAARARLFLANSNLERERRLFAEKVSPEQDLIVARTQASEAQIALRLAEQQLSAAGQRGGPANRLGVVAPLSGQIISRSVALGETIAADTELYRVADLSKVAITMSLSPADAEHVRPGMAVEISAGTRRSMARIRFVSPVLDSSTRLVPAIAIIDNRQGVWRVGEAVSASIGLAAQSDSAISVSTDAIQTVEGETVVFVRTPEGFQAVPVKTGRVSGAGTVILSGLTGREEIAGRGSFILKAELGKGEAEHGH